MNERELTDIEEKRIRKLVEEGKIEFASQDRIDKLEDFAVEFFDKIMDMHYLQMLVTDKSALSDFVDDTDIIKELLEKIANYYKIDMNEIKEPYYIVDILELLEKKGHKPPSLLEISRVLTMN